MSSFPRLAWQRVPAGQLATDAALCAAWDRLNAARLDLPVLGAAAVNAALAVFGSGAEQLAVATADDGTIAAMVVLVPQGRLRWATFQPSQLPLGSWVAHAELPLDGLARSLLHSRALGFALALSFTQVDPLHAARPDAAPDHTSADYIPTAWLEVEGSFADYWAARGKNLRQNLRKQRNKLAADGIVPTMHRWHATAEMAPAIERYGRLESQGWKAGQGTAIHPSNAQGRFYTRLLEQAAARGEALLTEYRFGEQTVAMNLGLQRGGTWIVLKTAYDESVPKALSPASLLREEELQAIFEEGSIRRLEYYGRVLEWHTKLTDRQRILYHLTTYRWPWLKRAVERRRRAPAEDSAAEPRTADADA